MEQVSGYDIIKTELWGRNRACHFVGIGSRGPFSVGLAVPSPPCRTPSAKRSKLATYGGMLNCSPAIRTGRSSSICPRRRCLRTGRLFLPCRSIAAPACKSVDTAYRYIREGVSDLILAGGTEALSHAPLIFPQQGVRWFGALFAARTTFEKAAVALRLRPGFFKPVIGLERGLTDPVVELNMGQTAEVLAHLFNISRRDADAYAVESHLRLSRAQEKGWLAGEVETAFARDGTLYDHDDGVRPDSSVEKLEPGVRAAVGQGHGRQHLARHFYTRQQSFKMIAILDTGVFSDLCSGPLAQR